MITILAVILILLLCVVVFYFISSKGDKNNESSPPKPVVTYKLRDIGPAGGIIFYINPNAKKDGWKYLEAAPEDSGEGISWSLPENYMMEVPGGTSTEIGEGYQNTKNIVALNGKEDFYAAGLAQLYDGGGYNDWFLPSKEELNKMYINLKSGLDENRESFNPNNSFIDHGKYWSSSELNQYYAWLLEFISGYPRPFPKDYNDYILRVRAIRAF